MTLRVAINGFGRIGRNFMRCWLSRGANTGIEVVGLNDTSDPRTNAHLLEYDTMLGHIRDAEVSYTDDSIIVNGKSIKCFSDRNPLNLPWKEWGVDLVIEATGVFIDQKGAGKHIEAGASKVLITAPGKGEGVGTFVVGVNAHEYRHDDWNIISNASCTTNCMAPLVKVLDQSLGIIKGMMTTTHSYTGDQRILDASHRDLRRARAAAVNIVPTSTGAATAVALVYPPMKGKLNGIAMRVPTPNVSVVDMVLEVSRSTTKEEVNAIFKAASQNEMKGIIKYSDLPLVSTDHAGTNESTIVDSDLTMVMDGNMVKVISWYDNEWGYSQRVVDLAEVVASNWK
ncbi:type I glyceraldehyde-3-phosphate dehydrogenase [Synechococcus sp. CCY9201]|uniref:type I glyceraldehyde-3-phosphate dehydrogenase n=1 Tax=unclassified Synechococcus TaxID=2626047 RepID=UPI0018CFD457|nr:MULTISPECIES: type I glyceraldehyde-3-phosphate dehydrogenase [unclassified Synechococcus]MEA5423478.1 type I glyceraldehyde-3-phosphate dehydrogenase [Synechococcus sp. CCY9202]MEA5475797.1 type I glyceraldehyde-3-phosphate dehydrogenase [Synechococcus sp. CCY9201]QPN60781.1 type I glyceraldehyde-3-phosphate dehydrogenase [Synechococcus sp. CBW1002]QPN67516.1 type I glyceraldehyde-3-phosphate dehydrogenase [Synechococcus sp. CBW1006]CAK6686997.1 Glyceraldehyde-3-phosphate dehydrogenase 2 [